VDKLEEVFLKLLGREFRLELSNSGVVVYNIGEDIIHSLNGVHTHYISVFNMRSLTDPLITKWADDNRSKLLEPFNRVMSNYEVRLGVSDWVVLNKLTGEHFEYGALNTLKMSKAVVEGLFEEWKYDKMIEYTNVNMF